MSNLIELLKKIFEDKALLKLGYNLKKQMKVMQLIDIELSGNFFDLSVAHYVLHPDLRHDLELIADSYLSVDLNNENTIENKTKSADLSSSDEVDVFVVLDGLTTRVKVKKDGKSILDAALDAGLDAPFSCQGGVCCSCRCKMDKGTASMDINYALEEDEVENGFVLSCQAHPTGNGPWVADFDQQ